MFGIEQFNAIINPPQSCILAIGAGVKQTVVTDNDEIAIASIAKVTLSCDHRVVDGAIGAQFLGALKDYIENPVSLIF
jgi:pyruvate dehydrogenase E2 component (dihydrolipoamide acetyltransferase)